MDQRHSSWVRLRKEDRETPNEDREIGVRNHWWVRETYNVQKHQVGSGYDACMIKDDRWTKRAMDFLFALIAPVGFLEGSLGRSQPVVLLNFSLSGSHDVWFMPGPSCLPVVLLACEVAEVIADCKSGQHMDNFKPLSRCWKLSTSCGWMNPGYWAHRIHMLTTDIKWPKGMLFTRCLGGWHWNWKLETERNRNMWENLMSCMVMIQADEDEDGLGKGISNVTDFELPKDRDVLSVWTENLLVMEGWKLSSWMCGHLFVLMSPVM